MLTKIGSIPGAISLVLIATSILFMLFVVLPGIPGINVSPWTKTYFLSADTSAVTGARTTSQWTFFYVCGANNQNCGSPVPALPFGYAWVGGGEGAPTSLLGKHGKGTTSFFYYFAWRFGWVFWLAGFVMNVIGFFLSILAPCMRIAAGTASLIQMITLLFFTIGASLMTAEFVKARNAFRSNGQSAKIGTYAFAFTWAAWACILISSILLFLGCVTGRNKDHTTTTTSNGAAGGNRMFFRRQRSKRSTRGSFVDGESQRRVKDEYN
ncbi:Protein SUR7 [Lachnellula suecica]|uniref:Protein SUR7 n=1 Tax=Lachnellula suecica TaxID=602035 RepID=A0A8T9BUJ6_9HELO|nr:Protein SUR7 [Lachnellula suecica]